jgi:hypothetical protein
MRSLPPFVLYVILMVLAYLLKSCASIQPPSGGDKDTIAPSLVSSFPAYLSTNFRGKALTMEFDEVIEVPNIKKELLIAPLLKGGYDAEVRKKVLIIKFDSSLQENTTYTFNFRKSVVDFTEKNPAKNLKLIFSTGGNIDSLSVSGRITDLLTTKPVQGASVLLFPVDDTLNLEGSKPYYATVSDENGYYFLEYLRPDNYLMFAISEADGNMKYSLRNESVGFLSDTLRLQKNMSGVDFRLTSYDIKPLKKVSARPRKQYFEIKYNKTPINYQLNWIDSTSVWIDSIRWKQTADEIRFYSLAQDMTDSIPVIITATDSVQNTVIDTVMVKFVKQSKPDKTKFTVNLAQAQNNILNINDSLSFCFVFNKPLQTFYADSIAKLTDKDTLMVGNIFKKIGNDTVLSDFELFTAPVIYRFPKGTFISVEGDTALSFDMFFKLRNPEDYGLIKGKVITKHKNYIIQLLNDKYEVEQEAPAKANHSFTFENVIPGQKQIRVLIDENNNGVWDRGDYKKRIQAEPVHIHQNPIQIKGNWEILDTKVSF